MELLKERSDFLRHPLMEQLVTEESNISEEAVQLMKFHGSYQQDDRYEPARLFPSPTEQQLRVQACVHVRVQASTAGVAECRDKRTFGQGKFYQFMMRTRQPAGLVSNQLYLTMDDLADQVCGRFGCTWRICQRCPEQCNSWRALYTCFAAKLSHDVVCRLEYEGRSYEMLTAKSSHASLLTACTGVHARSSATARCG